MTDQVIPAEAVEAAAKALADVDPLWPDGAWETMHDELREQALGMAGVALEAAAPYMSSLSVSSLSAEEIEAVEVMIKTAKANGWNEGYAAGMDRQVPEPRA